MDFKYRLAGIVKLSKDCVIPMLFRDFTPPKENRLFYIRLRSRINIGIEKKLFNVMYCFAEECLHFRWVDYLYASMGTEAMAIFDDHLKVIHQTTYTKIRYDLPVYLVKYMVELLLVEEVFNYVKAQNLDVILKLQV